MTSPDKMRCKSSNRCAHVKAPSESIESNMTTAGTDNPDISCHHSIKAPSSAETGGLRVRLDNAKTLWSTAQRKFV